VLLAVVRSAVVLLAVVLLAVVLLAVVLLAAVREVRDEREADLGDGRVAALEVLGGTVPPFRTPWAPGVTEAAPGF
jgi:uncharacterized SAM-binding protein YcdF (DUF218 family)